MVIVDEQKWPNLFGVQSSTKKIKICPIKILDLKIFTVLKF